MARPRKYDDSIRDVLIDEAARTIAQDGPSSLALRPLAERCGCTTSTIYAQFGGRDELIGAVITHVVDSFTQAQQAVPRTPDALADLFALGESYRSWAVLHPEFYAIMFGGSAGPPDPPPSCSGPDASIEPLVNAIERALAAGTLGGGTAEQITISIWSGVHGWVSLELAGMTPQGPRRSVAAYRAHLDALLRAWRPT